MKKWNFETRQYEPYEVSKSWTCVCHADLDKIVNCASCGKKIFFGNGYTSRQIHTDIGIGYCVCEECHNKEWELEKEFK